MPAAEAMSVMGRRFWMSGVLELWTHAGVSLSFGAEGRWRRRLAPHVADIPDGSVGAVLASTGFGCPGRLSRVKKVVEPGGSALQLAIGSRNECLQVGQSVGGFGAVVHRHPDARLIDDLAAAHQRAAARAISHLLRTGLGTDVLHVAEHAVAARFTPEDRALGPGTRTARTDRATPACRRSRRRIA